MIRNYKEFINEVSGTELVGPVGPAYGETRLQNKTISSHDTNVIYSDLDGNFYADQCFHVSRVLNLLLVHVYCYYIF